MELIFLAGLSIPALTLMLIMVSFYQSMKRINWGVKIPHKKMINAIEKKQARTTEENSDFKHIDFSGGLLGI